jgi:hypothetical protein
LAEIRPTPPSVQDRLAQSSRIALAALAFLTQIIARSVGIGPDA